MTWSPIELKPGIDTVKTPTLNSDGWSYSNLIRWREGLPEKLGGWTQFLSTALLGVARALHAWADLLGNDYLAAGTEQRLEIFFNGFLFDVTPIRATTNNVVNFSTINGSAIVTIIDALHGASTGDWINIVIPVSVGGIVLQGLYQVTVTDLNTYTIVSSVNATATVNNGGAVPLFNSTIGSSDLSVTLNNNGYTAPGFFSVQVGLTIAGIVLNVNTQYSIISITSPNVFVIVTSGTAGSTTSASENGGSAQIQYLFPSGLVSNTAEFGYGIGLYGEGLYGESQTNLPAIVPLRLWFLDNWGQDLIGNYNGSPIFVWTPPVTPGNVALAINDINFPGAIDPPVAVNVSFVTMPEQIYMALGCDPPGGGIQEPLLVRWCSQGDFTDWMASATNQAGSYLIPTGSRLVGGIQGPLFGCIWTDIDLWIYVYLGFPLVFGFNKVSGGVGLLGPKAAGVAQSEVYFVTSNSFMLFDGNTVRQIPCPIWDVFWKNLNRSQANKVLTAVNSWFSEVAWFFPSASGAGEVDSYVKFNYRESEWDYGSLVRTAWIDENVFGPPIGVDGNSIIQQHETQADANGNVLGEFIQSGFFDIRSGEFFSFLDRVIAQFLFIGNNPSLQYWIVTLNYPTDTPVVSGPYTQTPTGPEYQIIRARGRYAALRVGPSSVGTFWRFGSFLYHLKPGGSR